MSFQIKLYHSVGIFLYLAWLVQCELRPVRNGICSILPPRSYRKPSYTCCPGYIRDDTVTRLKCNPLCYPACTNGKCISPGVCLCYLGYKVDPENERNCLVSCSSGCPNGQCVAPDICGCNHGYEKVNGVCSPVCTEPCRNGTCVQPENCECNPGYRKSENNTCDPYCSTGCNEGRHCIAPDRCGCDAGWRPGGLRYCEPVCSPSCFNGLCVAPNTCQCNEGYEKFDTAYTCVPRSTTSTTTSLATSEMTTFTDTWSIRSTLESSTSTDDLEDTTYEATNSETEMISDISTEISMEIPTEKEPEGFWMYIVLGAMLMLVATLVLVAIVLRKKLLSCIKGGSYAVQDCPSKSTPDSFNVTFSSIKQQ